MEPAPKPHAVPPDVSESVDLLSGALAELQTSFRTEPEAARRLMAVGESPHDPALDVVVLAAYASLANAVLGTDEAITRN